MEVRKEEITRYRERGLREMRDGAVHSVTWFGRGANLENLRRMRDEFNAEMRRLDLPRRSKQLIERTVTVTVITETSLSRVVNQ